VRYIRGTLQPQNNTPHTFITNPNPANQTLVYSSTVLYSFL